MSQQEAMERPTAWDRIGEGRQRLIQLLRASVACSYCLGWGRIWFKDQINQIEVLPRWGYDGWPMKALGCLDVAGDGVVECPICRGTGESC